MPRVEYDDDDDDDDVNKLQDIARQQILWQAGETASGNHRRKNLKSCPSTAYVAHGRPALGTRTVSSTCICKQSDSVSSALKTLPSTVQG